MISRLLHPLERPRHNNVAEWFNYYRSHNAAFSQSIDRALWAGRSSRCLGYAFTGAYQAALESLFPAHLDCTRPQLAALCVSEANGNRPRHMTTQLRHIGDQIEVSGEKSFVAGAQDAELVFVCCRSNDLNSGQATLKIVKIATPTAGLCIHPLPTLPFTPEVSHGKVRLNKVMLSCHQVLPGDGYADYVKPFRTIEDLHVIAATTGYLLGESLAQDWPRAVTQGLLATIAAVRSCQDTPWSEPALHLLLAGIRSQLDALTNQCANVFAQQAPADFSHWQRDQALLNIAHKPFLTRTEQAWQHFPQRQSS